MQPDFAAIQGTFSEWRMVKSRSVLQLVVEVPIERTADVLTALGQPIPGQENWVAIARLAPSVATTARAVEGTAEPQSESRKRWNELPAAQRCAMRCADAAFQEWLGISAGLGPHGCAKEAARIVRETLGVESRRELTDNSVAAEIFERMDSAFQRRVSFRQFLDGERFRTFYERRD